VYAMLWRHLAAARAGLPGDDGRLARAVSAVGAHWPAPGGAVFLGRLSAAATIAAARTPAPASEGRLYVGAWKLLRNDKAGAAAGWQAALDRCPKSFIEYKGARAELQRLNPP